MLRLIGAILIVVSLTAAGVAAFAMYEPMTMSLMATTIGWRMNTCLGHTASSLVFIQAFQIPVMPRKGLYTQRLYVTVSRGPGGIVVSSPPTIINATGMFNSIMLPSRGARLEVYIVDQKVYGQVSKLLTPPGLVPSSTISIILKLLGSQSLASKSREIRWDGTSVSLGIPAKSYGAVMVIRLPLSKTALNLLASSGGFSIHGGTVTVTITVTTPIHQVTTTTFPASPGSANPPHPKASILVGGKIAEEMDKALEGKSNYSRAAFMDAFMMGVRGRMEVRSVVYPGMLGLMRSVSLGLAGFLVVLLDAARNPESYEGAWRVFRLLAEKLGIAGSSEQR